MEFESEVLADVEFKSMQWLFPFVLYLLLLVACLSSLKNLM